MLAASEIAAFLKSLPHFRLLEESCIAQIARHARLRSFEAQQAIFFEKDPATSFFAIRVGGAKLFRLRPDGREHVIHLLEAPQTFAEAAVFNFEFYPVNATATASPTELIEIAGGPLKDLMAEDPSLAGMMIGSLSMRLLDLVERVEDLASANAGTRLARYLLKLTSHGPASRPIVELPLAKKDLAARLSITPETLSRVLRKWQDRKLIDATQRTFVLTDTASLLAIADGEETTSV